VNIDQFYFSWQSGDDPDQFAARMTRLGLHAHVIDDGQADRTVVVADEPITYEQAWEAYTTGVLRKTV
jgi:hypothetical protein